MNTPLNPLHILCCSSTMEGGGSERQMLYLLNGLDRRHHQPYLYLLYRSGILLDQLPKDVPVQSFWDDYQSPRLTWPGQTRLAQIRHLTDSIRKSKIDVVYDRLFHLALITGAACRRSKTKRIATIVSPPQNDLLQSERRFIWLKKRILRSSYLSADRLISVSRGTAKSASEFYRIPMERFHVLPSPVDLQNIVRKSHETLASPISLPDREQLATTGTQDKPHRIVSIGRMTHEKGHRYLLHAFAQARRQLGENTELHLIGDGPLRNELVTLAAELKSENAVHFHGHLANPFPILRQAQLFVLPSLYEGLPNVLLEAMGLSIPCLATDAPGGIRELTLDGELCPLVPTQDANALETQILDRFRNPNTWKGRTDAALEHIQKHHNLSQWIESLESLFQQVVSNPN